MVLLSCAMFFSLAGFAFAGAWQLVYYKFRCRKAPIQKAAILGACILWLLCGAIFAFV
jgi:hypothetical protein